MGLKFQEKFKKLFFRPKQAARLEGVVKNRGIKKHKKDKKKSEQ